MTLVGSSSSEKKREDNWVDWEEIGECDCKDEPNQFGGGLVKGAKGETLCCD